MGFSSVQIWSSIMPRENIFDWGKLIFRVNWTLLLNFYFKICNWTKLLRWIVLLLIYNFRPKTIAIVVPLVLVLNTASCLTTAVLTFLLLQHSSKFLFDLIVFDVFVLTQNMLPTQSNPSFMINEQIVFLKFKINIGSFKRAIPANGSFHNMPNLILMKRQ